jgi:hypothetical protein
MLNSHKVYSSTVRSQSVLTADVTAVIYPADRAGSAAGGSSMDVQDPDQALRWPATADDNNEPVWREQQGRLGGAWGIQPLDQVAEGLRGSRGRLQDGFALLEGFAADAD